MSLHSRRATRRQTINIEEGKGVNIDNNRAHGEKCRG